MKKNFKKEQSRHLVETHCGEQCSVEFSPVSQLEKNKLEKSKQNHQQQQLEENEEQEGVGSTSTGTAREAQMYVGQAADPIRTWPKHLRNFSAD